MEDFFSTLHQSSTQENLRLESPLGREAGHGSVWKKLKFPPKSTRKNQNVWSEAKGAICTLIPHEEMDGGRPVQWGAGIIPRESTNRIYKDWSEAASQEDASQEDASQEEADRISATRPRRFPIQFLL